MGTRPEAVTERMDAASVGLDGSIRQLARMLAIVDYERDEDLRVFGFSRKPEAHYAELREAARQAVAEAGGRTQLINTEGGSTAATCIVFKNFNDAPTAIFVSGRSAGRILCFSCRDGHFSVAADEIDKWPNTEPTGQLLMELAENFWPE